MITNISLKLKIITQELESTPRDEHGIQWTESEAVPSYLNEEESLENGSTPEILGEILPPESLTSATLSPITITK